MYLKRWHGGQNRLGPINTPQILGIIDSSSFINIIIQANDAAFYSFVILIKIAFLYKNIDCLRNENRFLAFSIVAFLAIILSSLVNQAPIIATVQPIAVCLSVLLTIYLIEDKIRHYAMGYAISGLAICILFILSVNAGLVSEVYGRYNFIGDKHPNLGGEIISATLVMAAISIRPIAFLLFSVMSLYCTFLLQSRSSTLAIIVAIICYGFPYFQRIMGFRRAVLMYMVLAWSGVTITALLVVAKSENAQAVFDFVYESIFFVDNQYRGGDSGISGRSDNWSEAIGVIMDHPFIGAGPAFVERLGLFAQPHNWLLYAVSQFGVLGWIITVIFGGATYAAVRNDPIRATVIIPMSVLWIFNDRFLNFNAYPLALYIIVFASFSSHRVMPSIINQRT